MTNFVVLRSSPDWLSFNLSDAKPFLLAGGYDPSLLDRFVEFWDAHFHVDFRSFRHRLKIISTGTASRTGAKIINKSEMHKIQLGDQIVFLDDDDWLAPCLFDFFPIDEQFDGQRWPSIRVGLDYDPTSPKANIIQKRPKSKIVYTNNYSVSGSFLANHSSECVFEHSIANNTFNTDGFRVNDHMVYLSCAVKHPCCTTAMIQLIEDTHFIENPLTVITLFANGLDSRFVESDVAWLHEPMSDLRRLFNEAVGRQ